MKEIYTSATKISLILLILGLIYMSIQTIDINETFKTTLLMVVSFYFGQKVNQPIA